MALLRGTATFCAPLAVTTAWYHPSVTAVGVALQYFLASITYNSLQNPKQINKLLETAAISSLVTTSSTNRITRFLLGLVHTYAAISLSFRSQKTFDAKNQQKKESTTVEKLQTGVWQMLTFGGTLALTSIAATWFSSGYYAQWGRGAHPTAPSWNPDGLGWRLMPEVLRQPFKEQGAKTSKAAFKYAMIAGVLVRLVAWMYSNNKKTIGNGDSIRKKRK